MIFLTVGTQGPFDRLVKAVDCWCAKTGHGQEVFGQISKPGLSAKPTHFEWVERLAPDQFSRNVKQARLVISHAGMGTIISALQDGKQIVVMPRRFHLGEHRNDHQFATVKKLHTHPNVHVAFGETEFDETVDRALSPEETQQAQQISEFADPKFINALRDLIQRPT